MLSRWLRKINTDTERLKKAYTLWKKEDQTVSVILPGKKKTYLQFEVDTGWSGFIDLEQWYCRCYPKLATLAPSHVLLDRVYELFTESETPLVLPQLPIYESLKFSRLVSTDWITQPEYPFTQNCFSFETSKGRIWVTQLQEKHMPSLACSTRLQSIINTLPVCVKCTVGQSRLSLPLFKQMKVGDILLIQKTRHTLCIDDNVIGTYQIQNEGIMIDLHHLDLAENEEEEYAFVSNDNVEEFYDTIQNDDGAVPGWLNRKNTIPITLSFILEQKKIKLGELESLTQGMRLTLPPESYKHIEIEANGVAIAKGEIVIVDDAMAVEVTAIYGES